MNHSSRGRFVRMQEKLMLSPLLTTTLSGSCRNSAFTAQDKSRITQETVWSNWLHELMFLQGSLLISHKGRWNETHLARDLVSGR